MNDSRLAEAKREVSEWRDGRGMLVILGIAAVFAVAWVLNATGVV